MQPAILTDIEGTTSSISFVKNVLFPYARRELPRFVREHGHEPEVRRWLDQVAVENGAVCSDDVIVETLQGWIDQDRKHTALKALQGRIWEAGYAAREYQAHVYADAAAAARACASNCVSWASLASTAVPTVSTKPAMPGRVSVVPISAITPRMISTFSSSAKFAYMPKRP